MSSGTDITVIIVNYNVKDFLLHCLNSVRRSREKLNLEIIVIDNNSSDGSVETLSPIFPDVEFIALDRNTGFGAANNIGIEKAKGKYILILNPDTLLKEDTLQKTYEFMEKNPDAGITGCKVLNPDGTFQIASRRGFPTPWASFCKLFGLQKIFPKSRLFSKYNQTYLDINHTCDIDAVIGAFMFCRADVLKKTGGFDTDYFMYGEDLDLCYSILEQGYKVKYFHETSIIHYKGESTRRSEIDKIMHFYEAMQIFAAKHYSGSKLLLAVIKAGIYFRSFLAKIAKFRNLFVLLAADLIAINGSFLLATRIKAQAFFGLPDYAYPTSFIALSVIIALSMIVAGDYFSSKPHVRKSLYSYLISFFVLSSITYFFKEYNFSRGLHLMTVVFSMTASVIFRLIILFIIKSVGKESDRRIAFAGINDRTESLISALSSAGFMNARIIGIISFKENYPIEKYNLSVLGHISDLDGIIRSRKIDEIIITDDNLPNNELISLIEKNRESGAAFRVITEYDEFIASEIIKDISGIEPTLPVSRLQDLRVSFVKRMSDVLISVFLLSIGLPLIFLFVNYKKALIGKLIKVFKGDYSFIGLFDNYKQGIKPEIGKIGILGLAHLSDRSELTEELVEKLNEYYISNYSYSLDVDIFLKFIFRKKSGNQIYT